MDMGPTVFLPGTQGSETIDIWNVKSRRDEIISSVEPVYATLKCGDVVLFDARILHCGSANDVSKGSTRALFNLSFRNPQVQGDLGYKGSIRSGYENMFTLGSLGKILEVFDKDEKNNDPFLMYGNGL